MKLNKTHECLNCHEQIGDSNFCPNCGQVNSDKKLSVKEITNDFLGDFLTFDSKFFKSLFPLMFKPGYLTNKYLSGKRVSYVLPFRLYLFTTFLFFLIVAVNTQIDQTFFEEQKEEVPVIINESDDSEKINKDSLITIINSELSYLPESVRENMIANIDTAYNDTGNVDLKSMKRNNSIVVFNADSSSDGFFEKYISKKANLIADRGKEGQRMFIKELIDQIPKVMFFLLPAFALLLKFIYVRRRFYYVEHLIFTLHIHTFIFLHLIITVFFQQWYVITAVFFSIMFYLLFALKNVYSQSWGKTVTKFILLLGGYFFLLIPTFVLLALLALISI